MDDRGRRGRQKTPGGRGKKLTDLAAWYSGAERIPCPICREVHAPKEPPCGTCYPGMHVLNATAFEVWGAVRNQWRYSFNGPEALDYLAVDLAVRRKGIPEALWLVVAEQVLTIGDVIVDEAARERKRREAEAGRAGKETA